MVYLEKSIQIKTESSTHIKTSIKDILRYKKMKLSMKLSLMLKLKQVNQVRRRKRAMIGDLTLLKMKSQDSKMVPNLPLLPQQTKIQIK